MLTTLDDQLVESTLQNASHPRIGSRVSGMLYNGLLPSVDTGIHCFCDQLCSESRRAE